MKRSRSRRAPALAMGALLLAGAAWWVATHRAPDTPVAAGAAVAIPATSVDAANEGHLVSVEGTLRVIEPARDPQLGVSADALVLLRDVQMLQWRETCADGRCTYALEWSAQPIDSRAFKDAVAHANPRLPFSSARFASTDVRLGAFHVEATFAADAEPAVAYAVHANQLPANLAATFRERDGVLHASADPARAAAGDLRVSYRIIAAGPRHLCGVQRGNRLQSPQTH